MITGNPVTKKNHQQIIMIPDKYHRGQKRPSIIQSAQYRKYEAQCIKQITGFHKLNVEIPVNVQCVYYMQKRTRVDLVNLLEATDDILVKAGVLKDDCAKIVASHDFSRVNYDKDNPRVEITITEAEQ